MGRKYSWNNIIKSIDYEQVRDRAIILENNGAKRGIDSSSEKSPDTAKASTEKAGHISRWHIKTNKQPKSNLEKAQGIGLKSQQIDDNPWNAFKLELDDDRPFKKKRRKGRGRRF